MSGIDRITEKIISQAELQAKNRISYAAEEAEKAKSSLEKRFERTMEHEVRKAADRGKEAADRIIANTRLEGRKKKLAARQDTVNEVFNKVIGKLAGLPEEKYIDFLCRLSIPVLDDGDNALILSSSDRRKIGNKLVKELNGRVGKGNITLSEETIKTAGGLIVKSGDIQTNLTLEAIIRLEREKLESEVVGILFGSE